MTKEDHPILDVRGVFIAYDDKAVVLNAGITLNKGEIGCILGPSGCGKSTLLRCIAGFEQPLSGSISMNGDAVSTSNHILAPEKRGISMVFQDVVMFPHISVAKNIAFGLRNWSAQNQAKRVKELLELIGLIGYGDRHPHSLSGGEQQRVALARAIAPRPKLLLMDEAFSNLDAELRRTLIPEVRVILNHENISAILVTHDHHEAFAIADKIGVMENGRIHQWDVPFNVYHKPGDRFTAQFIGEGELIPATVIDDQNLQTVFGRHPINKGMFLNKGEQVDILVRPDDILHDDDSKITGKVLHKSFRGSHFMYRLRLEGGQQVICLADSHHNHRIGEWIGLSPNIEHVVIFRRNGEEEINYSDQAIRLLAESGRQGSSRGVGMGLKYRFRNLFRQNS